MSSGQGSLCIMIGVYVKWSGVTMYNDWCVCQVVRVTMYNDWCVCQVVRVTMYNDWCVCQVVRGHYV